MNKKQRPAMKRREFLKKGAVVGAAVSHEGAERLFLDPAKLTGYCR